MPKTTDKEIAGYFIHKNCGREISFDSFGNWKCKRCKRVDKKLDEVEFKATKK